MKSRNNGCLHWEASGTPDGPGDHRAELHLLLHLQPVKQARGRSLHSQAQHVDLDNKGRRRLDHPHAQQVGGVRAGVVRRSEAALQVGENGATA